jgi:hypothetical protein
LYIFLSVFMPCPPPATDFIILIAFSKEHKLQGIFYILLLLPLCWVQMFPSTFGSQAQSIHLLYLWWETKF